MNESIKKNIPIIVAVTIAVIVLIWYVASGRSSFDTSTRELATQEDVQEVDISDPQLITITCKDGQQYKILFTEGQDNYDDLIFNNCGEAGAIDPQQ
ncbi:hypothetical protein KC725_01595 [Candidatus Peregrinibacteria bacterium]|nr:hypothetical protein [Candidatus Peregrinibacteria bacterium]